MTDRFKNTEEGMPMKAPIVSQCRPLARISALLVAAGLGACGGGGGGGSAGGLTMTLSTNALTFTSTDGGTPVAQAVTATFSGSGSGTLYLLIVPADPNLVSVGGITTTGTNSGQGTVTPAPTTTVGIGSHSTTIQVSACLNDPTCQTGEVHGSPQTITVAYNISGLSASVANLSYQIGNSPTAAAYTSNFTVTGYPNNQNWTSLVSTTAPWLTLTPATGSTSAAVTVSATLNQGQINALANGTYTGDIYLTPANGNQVDVPVTLTVAQTKVDFVAPYVGTSGTSDNIVIRGEHFDLLAQPVTVNLGTTAATSVAVVSATEVHATYPALGAGRYPVQLLGNAQVTGASRATLVVVNPPSFSAAVIPYPTGNAPQVQNLVYDAERQAILTQLVYDNSPNPSTYSLARIGYSASAWGAPVVSALTQASAFTLSIDGTQVLTSYNDSTSQNLGVTPLDPTTLVPSGAVTTNPLGADVGAYSIGVANDGNAIITAAPFFTVDNLPVLSYSELLPNFARLQVAGIPPYEAVVAASGDGATVFLASKPGNPNGSPPVAIYTASSGQLSQTASIVQSASVAVDRHGTRVLLNATDVYDAGINKLGSLPTTTVASTISADATRAYAYDGNGTVRVFDLTASPVNSFYPEITPAKTLLNSPATSTWASLVVSPDGGSLFVAIASGIYVVPLP
jgi:hypothetical protein